MNYDIFGKKEPYPAKEDYLQIWAANYLTQHYPSLLWWHTPNGGNRSRTEARRFKKMGVLAGVSDIIILAKNKKYSGICLELKTHKGQLRQTQKDFLNQAAAAGFYCAVCYNQSSIKEVLKNYFKI